MRVTDLLGALLSFVAGAVLVLSGVLKLGTASTFVLTLTQFGLPRWTWADLRFARAFPWCEIALGLGVLLLPGPWHLVPLAATLLLFVAFLVLTIRVSRHTTRASCNCFGGLGDDTVSTRTVVRNSVLVAVAAVAVALDRAPASVAADRLGGWSYPLPAVLAVLLALALVWWRGRSERRRQAEAIAALSVRDVHGAALPLTEFQQPPTFLVFFSAGCGGCHALVEHFRWWPNLLKDGYDLQPVFLGTPESFADQEAFAPLAPHAWYADPSLAGELGIAGTPAAILIDPEHPLGHQMSGGYGAIQELVLVEDWRDRVRQASVERN